MSHPLPMRLKPLHERRGGKAGSARGGRHLWISLMKHYLLNLTGHCTYVFGIAGTECKRLAQDQASQNPSMDC